MATILAKMENLAKDIHGDKNDTKRAGPMEFMPEWGIPKEEAEEKKAAPATQSVDDQKSILLAIAAAQNRKVERKRVKE